MKFLKYIKDLTIVFALLLLFSCEEEFEVNSSYFLPIDKENKAIVYNGEKTGEFKEFAKSIDWKTVEKLTVKGRINQDDIYRIRKYTSRLYGSLKELDFREVDILEGTFLSNLFYGNNYLIERFVYPRKMMNTGDYVFYRCRSIKEIIIPEEVEILGAGALYAVDRIKVKPKPLHQYRYEYYYDKPMPKERYTIPDMVKELGELCYGWYPYKTIEIPNSVEKFGLGCFLESKLESFVFPPKVTVVEAHLFSGCKRLKSVKMHNNITAIKDSAFQGAGIEELTIPESVTSIGKAVIGLKNLKKLHVKWQIPPPATNTFNNASGTLATLYVPKGTKAAYQNAEGWKKFGTIIEE